MKRSARLSAKVLWHCSNKNRAFTSKVKSMREEAKYTFWDMKTKRTSSSKSSTQKSSMNSTSCRYSYIFRSRHVCTASTSTSSNFHCIRRSRWSRLTPKVFFYFSVDPNLNKLEITGNFKFEIKMWMNVVFNEFSTEEIDQFETACYESVITKNKILVRFKAGICILQA